MYSINLKPIAIFCNNNEAIKIIETHFLNFWAVPHQINPNNRGDYFATIVYRGKLRSNIERSILIIPSKEREFQDWLKLHNLRVKYCEDQISFDLPQDTRFTLPTSRLYCYEGEELSPVLTLDGHDILNKLNREEIYLLSIDIIEEFQRVLREKLNPTPSNLLKISGRYSLSYELVPTSLRNYFLKTMGSDSKKNKITYIDKLPLDALRYLFLMALNKMTDSRLLIKPFWPYGKKYALCLTHDVETQQGLKRALKMKRIEQKYGVKALWNIPTQRYRLVPDIIRILAEDGEIGAHGTRHDGRLIFLSREELKDRIAYCKNILAKMSGVEIHGFRSPLLQHSQEIFEAAAQAQYKYTSTTTTWEPLHPSSMKPHGIGTVYPLSLEGIVEIPITLPQDHQLFRILKATPEESIRVWNRLRKWIRDLGGLCSLLIHPDYEFAEENYIKCYEKFVKILSEDKDCWVATPHQIAMWWRSRCKRNVEKPNNSALHSCGQSRSIELGYEKDIR